MRADACAPVYFSKHLYSILLKVFNQPVRISSTDACMLAIVGRCFSAFLVDDVQDPINEVELVIDRDDTAEFWKVTLDNDSGKCASLADVIYCVEKMMTIELQNRRSELFFLHGASVAREDNCIVILGASGAGKSTLCWALCHHGYRYLSDELAPIELETLSIEPYPHALCVKHEIDEMPPLPLGTIRTERTMHIPVEAIPSAYIKNSVQAGAIICIDTDYSGPTPTLRKIRCAEAAARIYANGLNQLAHQKNGLAAARRLGQSVPCYLLSRGRISEMLSALSKI